MLFPHCAYLPEVMFFLLIVLEEAFDSHVLDLKETGKVIESALSMSPVQFYYQNKKPHYFLKMV